MAAFGRVCIAILLLGSSPAWAKEAAIAPLSETKIIFGFVNSRPVGYIENGVVKGSANELFMKAMAKLGQPYELRVQPIKRIYRRLESGELHGWFGVHGSAQMAEATISGKLPIANLMLHLYSQTRGGVPSLWDVFDVQIITLAGYKYGGFKQQLIDSKKKVRFLDANNHAAAFAMLRAGRGQYVLAYHAEALRVMDKLAMENINDVMVQDIPLFIMVSKKAPHAKAMLALIERGIIDVWRTEKALAEN